MVIKAKANEAKERRGIAAKIFWFRRLPSVLEILGDQGYAYDVLPQSPKMR